MTPESKTIETSASVEDGDPPSTNLLVTSGVTPFACTV
jgi:hypothetical protein